MILQSPTPQVPFLQSTLQISIVRPAEEQPPQPVLYKVVLGDNLTKIAEAHNVPLERLWSANPELSDPDILTPDLSLKIPNSEDVIAVRPMPIKAVVTEIRDKQPYSVSKYSSNGNTYDRGYCTWYAKEMRPDLPNRMGNAINWASSARKAGFTVSSVPRAGAIGQYGNHVVYITSVNDNGTFNLSEMNARGLGVISTRSNVSPNGWQFIY